VFRELHSVIGDRSTGAMLEIRRPLATLLAASLLSVCASACDSSEKASTRTPADRHGAHGASAGASAPASLAETRRSFKHYLNDRDGDIGGRRVNSGYRDPDDVKLLAYGHPAGSVEQQAVRVTVERYYAAAAAEDGPAACSMLLPSLVKAVPEDYGQFGPSYLRGSKTCREAMKRLFKHLHETLQKPVAVTGVLVNGDHAYALLGSPQRPANYLTLERQGNRWTVATLLGSGMP
jgi:hypothetical protein